jgi:hypothetical protein
MITKGEFVKIIENDRTYNDIINKIDKEYKISFYGSDLDNCYSDLFNFVLQKYFNEDGIDLIYWWLYEDVDKTITSEDGSKIELNSARDLYDYLVNTTEEKHVYLNVE